MRKIYNILKNNINMNEFWTGVLKALIIASIIAIVSIGTAFIINYNVEKAIDIKNEELQNIRIDRNQKSADEINNKIDTFFTMYEVGHNQVIHDIDGLEKNINALTYVITKNNSEMKHELQEIKNINSVRWNEEFSQIETPVLKVKIN